MPRCEINLIDASFFPINDNDDVTEGHGGSHWYWNLAMKVNARSLLVVNRHIRLGLHYDSLNQRNYEVAKNTLDKISHLMNEGLKSSMPRELIARAPICPAT
jgi:hypothetical protein